jgi:hypothetical protein
VDAAGKGIAGAGLELRTPREGAAVNTEGLTMVSTSADGEGRFRIVDLHAGTQRLRVFREGYPTLESLDVELTEGERRRDLVITLGGELAISGRVLDPDGAGVAGARVYFAGPNPSPRSFPSAVSSEDGAFVISGLGPGEFALTAQPVPGRSEWSAVRFGPVRGGASGIVLQLARTALVTGKCKYRAWIVAFDAAESPIDRTVSDEQGLFRIRAAEGSTVELRAWKATPDPQYYLGFFADESAPPIATLRGVRAGATDVVIE